MAGRARRVRAPDGRHVPVPSLASFLRESDPCPPSSWVRSGNWGTDARAQPWPSRRAARRNCVLPLALSSIRPR